MLRSLQNIFSSFLQIPCVLSTFPRKRLSSLESMQLFRAFWREKTQHNYPVVLIYFYLYVSYLSILTQVTTVKTNPRMVGYRKIVLLLLYAYTKRKKCTKSAELPADPATPNMDRRAQTSTLYNPLWLFLCWIIFLILTSLFISRSISPERNNEHYSLIYGRYGYLILQFLL